MYFIRVLVLICAGLFISQALSAQESKERKSHRFLSYTYEKYSPMGISYGSLGKRFFGVYANVRWSRYLLHSDNGEIDSEGNPDVYLYSNARTIQDLNETRNIKAALSFGYTFKIYKPVYLFIGFGAAYYSRLSKWESIDTEYLLEDIDRTYWLKHTDMSAPYYFPEAGLIIMIPKFFKIKYGVSYTERFGLSISETITHQFGVGFTF